MNPLHIAVTATEHRLQSQDAAERAQARRIEAWRAMSQSGMSHRKIATAMREALAARGLDAAAIRRAGVSHYNIGLALRLAPPPS